MLDPRPGNLIIDSREAAFTGIKKIIIIIWGCLHVELVNIIKISKKHAENARILSDLGRCKNNSELWLREPSASRHTSSVPLYG